LTKEQFKICFDEWFDGIRNYIFYKCGDTEKATDIAQETFLKVWQKQFKYHPQQTKALLYKIAHELWISEYRKIQTARKFELSLTHKIDENSPEHNLEYEELKSNYEKILAVLPEKQREVFLMSRMEELSYKEIADRLGLSVKAVEKRMSLALSELRNKLKK
jgi:RNA polymerase sigma-70 factor (ECF subfamily)